MDFGKIETNDKYHILVGTPAYGAQVTTPHVGSLYGFIAAGIKHDPYYVNNCPNITIARNNVFSFMYQRRKEYTHLLFLDGDIGITAKGLLRLLESDLDVVGARVPLKTPHPETGKTTYNYGALFDMDRKTLMAKTSHIGTAVMLIKSEVVERLAEALPESQQYLEEKYPGTRGDKVYNAFRLEIINGAIHTSDVNFCRQLRALGYDIHVDMGSLTTHTGMVRISGQQLKPDEKILIHRPSHPHDMSLPGGDTFQKAEVQAAQNRQKTLAQMEADGEFKRHDGLTVKKLEDIRKEGAMKHPAVSLKID